MRAKATPRESRRLLELDSVELSLGGNRILRDVTFGVKPGETTAIVGPNGAGKTSLLNCIAGLARPDMGSIRYDGEEIVGLAPHLIAGRGLARTFQSPQLIGDLTLLENVMLGAQVGDKDRLVGDALGLGSARRRESAHEDVARDALALLGIEARSHESVENLAYEDQKRGELARAIAMDARLIMADEPSAGMSPEDKRHLSQALAMVCKSKEIALVIIEHDMNFIGSLCETVVVLDEGKVIASGPPREVRHDQRVVRAYLGTMSLGDFGDGADQSRSVGETGEPHE